MAESALHYLQHMENVLRHDIFLVSYMVCGCYLRDFFACRWSGWCGVHHDPFALTSKYHGCRRSITWLRCPSTTCGNTIPIYDIDYKVWWLGSFQCRSLYFEFLKTNGNINNVFIQWNIWFLDFATTRKQVGHLVLKVVMIHNSVILYGMLEILIDIDLSFYSEYCSRYSDRTLIIGLVAS